MDIIYQLSRIVPPPADFHEASRLSGMHPEMIEAFLHANIVRSTRDGNGGHRFAPAAIDRLRQIQHLREHNRANLRTIRYIVGLLDALDEKEHELGLLRQRHPDPQPFSRDSFP